MIDFPRPSPTAPSALRRRKSDRASPPSASPPALRKLRRETPSQNGSGHPLTNVSMAENKITHQKSRTRKTLRKSACGLGRNSTHISHEVARGFQERAEGLESGGCGNG